MEGNVPLYVQKKSNHPPSILKNIPDSINKRLSEISSDRQCFDNAKTVYQEALNKSGYNYNLSYNEPRNEIQHSRKDRPRNILWYNPPFSKNVKTNVGKCFLSLIDQHFPKSHSLHKIFNRNTLKLSYSCMTNIKYQNHYIEFHALSFIYHDIPDERGPPGPFETVLQCSNFSFHI